MALLAIEGTAMAQDDDEVERRREIKASALLFENRQMRRLGEVAVGVAYDGKRYSRCEHAHKAFDAIVELIRKAHDLDLSDPAVFDNYLIPGATPKE